MSEQAGFDYDVFISYSHHDEAWVTDTLLPRLEEAGLRTCIDFRDFSAGKAALLNMQDAARNSRHTLLVLTKAWVESEWTLYESLLTRTKDPAGLQRRTVPLRLQPCEIPEFISMLTWVDFTRPDRTEIAWTQLLTALGAPPVPARKEEPMSEQAGFDYDVFISYSHADRAWVRGELLSRLEDAGLKVCIDYRDFEPGAPSVSEMERAVLASRKTLLVLTPDYLDSAWTEFEASKLQVLDPANRQRRLIPLRKQKCELPLRIGYLTYVDFAEPDDLTFAWTQLLTALGAPPVQEAPEPPTRAGSSSIDSIVPKPGYEKSGSTGKVAEAPARRSLGWRERSRLRQVLAERFSDGELRDLCFDLGIEYKDLPGKGKADKVRELVAYLERRDRIPDLKEIGRRVRPKVSW